MRRQTLFLLIFIPLLLLLTLLQLTAVQANQGAGSLASTFLTPLQQDDEEPTPEEDAAVGVSVPLSQPMVIRIRQTVPITVLLDLLGAVGVNLPITGTAQVTTAVSITALDGLTDTQIITTILPITLPAISDLLTDTLTDTLADTADLTGTPEITGLAELTDAVGSLESLPLEIPDATTLDEESSGDAATEDDVGDTSDEEEQAGVEIDDDLGASFPLTVEIDLQVFVSQTLTSTVPALLNLRFTGLPTATIPIAIEVAPVTSALLNVTPISSEEALTITEVLTTGEGLTETEGITGTDDITISEVVTVTGTLTPTGPVELVAVTVTVPVTANIRAGTSTDSEIVRSVPPQTVLTVVARDATSQWMLLDEGNWLSILVIGQIPPDLPAADDALVTALREAAALVTPTPVPPTSTPEPPTATPTPAVSASSPATVTTTTNANLRAGPGTDFDITGQTVLNQAIQIVARNEAGDWLRLADGNWISAGLVAGLPDIATIALFDPDAALPTATPELIPTATPPLDASAPVTETAPAETPTPDATAPVATLPTATPRPPSLGVDENLYLVDFDNINRNYQQALTAIDRLVDTAGGNTAVFDDPQWVTDMTTAIGILRNAGANVARMAVPERFAAAHNSLASAAQQYNVAADLLEAGLQNRDTAQFDAAFSAMSLGDASLAQATGALAQFRP